jgi:hypothetical protein
MRLDEITGLELPGFARRLREEGLAPSSVTVAMSVIRDLLVDAAAAGLIPAAPVYRIRQWRTGRGRSLCPAVAVELAAGPAAFVAATVALWLSLHLIGG